MSHFMDYNSEKRTFYLHFTGTADPGWLIQCLFGLVFTGYGLLRFATILLNELDELDLATNMFQTNVWSVDR